MKDMFEQVGFKNISETEINGKLDCVNAEGYWNFMNEVAGPVAAALSKVDNEVKAKIKMEVLKSVEERYPTGKTMVDSGAIVIYAEK
jgi:hypothetical protein